MTIAEEGRHTDSSEMIGEVIGGRFRVDAVIGAGGMSTVYRAYDQTLERDVAIKLLHREIARDARQLERFRREARAAAKLNHAHIVSVIDADEHDGRPYIVFEHVEGETLKQRIKRGGAMPIDQAVAYALEIAKALAIAHAAQIVHRDIKPQNVMLDAEGHAKVGDFGIARELEADGLTKTGRVLGTTDYVAPEQALGDPVTGRSDIYSLGIVLFEMLTGRVPFTGDSHVAVAMQHVKESLPDVQAIRPEVSAALAQVLDRMTDKDLKVRYSSASELIDDLSQVLGFEVARIGRAATGEVTTAMRALPRPSRRTRGRRGPRALNTPIKILGAGAVIAAAIYLVGNLERGTGGGERIRAGAPGKVVALAGAGIFDPPPGDGAEHGELARLVLDGNPQTRWTTERYENAAFPTGKTGVGIYVKTRRAVAASAIQVQTPGHDLSIEVYGARALPTTLTGWTKVGAATGRFNSKPIKLSKVGQLRYYMIWVTHLSSNGAGEISEIQLRT